MDHSVHVDGNDSVRPDIQAVRQQKWLHAQAEYPNGNQGHMWYRLIKICWAWKFLSSSVFNDGQQRARFELSEKTKIPSTFFLSVRKRNQGHFPTQTLTEDRHRYPGCLVPRKWSIKSRSNPRQLAVEWIEFELKLWRGGAQYRDPTRCPENRLPIRNGTALNKDLV